MAGLVMLLIMIAFSARQYHASHCRIGIKKENMESDIFAINQFTMARRKIRAIQLKAFYQLKELKGNGATYAFSVSLQDRISDITKRNNGHVIIKKESITPGDLVIICHDGEFFAVNFFAVEDYMAHYNAWHITRITAYQLMNRKENCIA